MSNSTTVGVISTEQTNISIEIENEKVKKVSFTDHNIFGNMVFKDIEDLNVITGPNGVGKSRLLKIMNSYLQKQSIPNIPIYIIFNNEEVKRPFHEVKNTNTDEHMSEKDMIDESTMVEYFLKHKHIKFGNDNTEDAININDYLKKNNFKYNLFDDSKVNTNGDFKKFFNFTIAKNETDIIAVSNPPEQTNISLLELSSGERTYYYLLLWSLIHEINIKLKNKGEREIITKRAKYVFFLGKFFTY